MHKISRHPKKRLIARVIIWLSCWLASGAIVYFIEPNPATELLVVAGVGLGLWYMSSLFTDRKRGALITAACVGMLILRRADWLDAWMFGIILVLVGIIYANI